MIGSPSAGRVQGGSEALVGFFVNTLALRLRPGAFATVGSYLSEVSSVVREGLVHEAAPFERVVERVGVERSLSHSPVYQAMFAWQSQGGGDLRLAGVTAEAVALGLGQAKVDLTLSLGPAADGGIVGGLEYDADLFEGVERCAVVGDAGACAQRAQRIEL